MIEINLFHLWSHHSEAVGCNHEVYISFMMQLIPWLPTFRIEKGKIMEDRFFLQLTIPTNFTFNKMADPCFTICICALLGS